MTTPNKLLVILHDCPSTADSAASHAGVPMLVAKAMLERHSKDGYAQAVTAGDLQLWKLTPTGLELAIALKKHAA